MKKIVGIILAIALLFGGVVAINSNSTVDVASKDPGTGGH